MDLELLDFGCDVDLRGLDESDDFLGSLLYAADSWFAVQRVPPPPPPLPALNSFSRGCFNAPAAHQPPAVLSSVAIPEPPPHSQSNKFTPASSAPAPHPVLSLPPLQSARSESMASTGTSPVHSRMKLVSRPISPPTIEKRRLRTFSTDSDSPADESSDDDSFTKSRNSKAPRRKRSRSSGPGVLHTSVFRGVSCCGKDRKFQARIRDGSKVHYLGRFDNEFDAALRYDEAARSHKGDSAIPNFTEMNPQEIRALRAHYFANNQTILPEFYYLLSQSTVERVELRRQKLGLTNIENGH